MGPGGPGGTHKDLDGLRWKNMGAGCMSPGPSALLSAMSCDTVGLTPLPPQAMLRHRAQAVAWHAAWCKACCRCQSNLAVGDGVVQDSECS